MTEKEKQAIETLIEIKEFSNLSGYLDVKTKQLNAIDIVTNLIDKQQVENEKLKDKNKTLEGLLQGNLYEMYLYYKELASRYQANCISKDTVREKIKKYDKWIEKGEYTESLEAQRYALNELLEE